MTTPTMILSREAFLKFTELPDYKLTRWMRYGIIPRSTMNFRRGVFTEESAVAARIAIKLRELNVSPQACPALVRYSVTAYRAAALFEPPTIPYLVVTVKGTSTSKTCAERIHIDAVPAAQLVTKLKAETRGVHLVDLPEIVRDVRQYFGRRGVVA